MHYIQYTHFNNIHIVNCILKRLVDVCIAFIYYLQWCILLVFYCVVREEEKMELCSARHATVLSESVWLVCRWNPVWGVGGWVSFAVWNSAVWWPARRSCLVFCWFRSWYCGAIFLMVALRRVHGSGGRSLWWSSVLSSYIAGCRCPGEKEAHLRRCAGPSALFSAGLSGWEWCNSRTRRWCSQSGCSPQCNYRTVWGFWA